MRRSHYPNSDRYSRTAIALHWATAILVLGSFAVGTYAVGLELSPFKLRVYSWHKWIGVTVFLLTLARLAWRWRHPAPPLPAGMRLWERIVARATHIALYVLLFVLPITGWLMSSAAGFPVVYLGLIQLPDLIAENEMMAEFFKVIHDWLNNTLFVLVLLHVVAALKHHVVDRDTVLTRMLPLLRPRTSSPGDPR